MRLAICFSIALVFSGVVGAQGAHVPTLDETVSLKNLDSARISPDGKYVAYRMREADWKNNTFVAQWWLVNVASGATFQLTRGRKSVGAAEWSPDGRWLAFVAERESSAIEPVSIEAKEEKKENPAPQAEAKKEPVKKEEGKKEEDKDGEGSSGKTADHQIWLISPEGGEAWQLTKAETDVEDFHWSKDGRWIAFSANPAEAQSAKDRKEKYSDYEVFEKDYQQKQLWAVDMGAPLKSYLPTAAMQLTSDAALNVNSFAWSPDATQIAFSATRNPLLAFSGEEDIYLLEVCGEHGVKKIVALPGPDTAPMFSPDGKKLAFYTALAQANYFYTNGHIASVDLATVATKAATTPADVQDMTKSFDEDPQPVDWGPDGIYFGAEQKTSSQVFRINTATLEIQRVGPSGAFVIEDGSLSKDFKTMALITEDATHMTEVYVSNVSPAAPKKLTDMTGQVKGWKLGTVEVVSWKSKDGATIEGVLHKPADYDATKKYPLLVMIHGGPTGTSQPTLSPDTYAYPMQVFLSKGALVLEPNYRGSAGYGAAFRALNVRNLGVGDMWDVMSGVDALIAKGIVDPARMGAMGWSEGGYISAFLTTHTDRFKAISVGAGISDWMTYYVNTDITPFTRQYLHATPWDDPEIYAKTSPITTIKQAKTPTLIQQGSNDKRVPVPDSFELYRGLQDQNVPARLILYGGFGHGIDKPKSQKALLQANLDWFNFYIWDVPIPKDSALYGASELHGEK
jgi:dipeptidyl aminopeptidase/acylaminoacyl peptidase